MPSSPLAPAALHLTHDAESDTLLVRWLPAPAAAHLPDTYPNTLTAASHHSHRRFWLFDLRDQHIPATGPWRGDLFALRTFCALGQPLYVAYVIISPFRAAIERTAIAAARQAGANYDIHPRCFGTVAAAQAWLQRQQPRHQPAPPALAPQP